MPQRSAVPLLLLAALVAAPLAAQPAAPVGAGPQGGSLSRELVQALLPQALSIRPDEPAPGLPSALLPPDGLVLGSMGAPSASTTAIVLAVPLTDAVAAHERRALAAGWSRPPAPATIVRDPWSPFGGAQRGFVSSPGAMPPGMVPPSLDDDRDRRAGRTSLLCRDDAQLSAVASPWENGRTLLRVQLTTTASYSRCRPPVMMAAVEHRPLVRHRTEYDSIIPVLQPPPNVEVFGGGGGGGSSTEYEMRAELRTSMPADSLLAHYAAEMQRAGWTPTGVVGVTPHVASQAWQKLDDIGRTWHAAIILAARPTSARYQASLRLELDGAPR